MREVNPKETSRGRQFEIWKNASNPMLTFVKKMDVTNLVKISKKKHLKFNMLLDYCIGKAGILSVTGRRQTDAVRQHRHKYHGKEPYR